MLWHLTRSRIRAQGLFLIGAVLMAAAAAPGQSPTKKKSGLHIAAGRRVNLTTRLNDGAGYTWDLQHYLNVGQGTNYAYSGGVYCQVSGTNVSSNGWAHQNATGDELEIGPWNRGNYEVYRRCKVYRNHGMARWLDIFVNKTNSAQTLPVRIYTCTNSSVSRTTYSTGGGSFGAKDWAFITEHSSSRPGLLHVVCGPRSKVRPTLRVSGNVIYVNYTVTIPPRGTAVLCYFESQGRTVAELQKRMKEFRASKMLRDLSPAVRKLIINFRSGGFLGDIELDRSGTGDAILLKNGDSIFGAIDNPTFPIKTFYGRFDIAAKDAIGFAAVRGRDDQVHGLLVGGQVVTGALESKALQVSLPTGGKLQIPFGRIAQCSYRITKSKPEDTPMSDPLILLRTGDRLAFDPAQLKCEFQTRHGRVELSGKDLLEIQLAGENHGVHRAMFLNGSTLAGLLGPEQIALPLKLGPTLKIPRDMLLAVRFAEEGKDDDDLASLSLTNEDELYGRLADKEFVLATDFGQVKISPANVVTMTFGQGDRMRVAVKMWNGTVHRGRIEQSTLRFALQPGPVLNVHVGHIASVTNPHALPPGDIVKRVEQLVARLSAASYKDRQEAEDELKRMGASVIPLLRKHLKSSDPEVRQRVRVILDHLGDKAALDPPAESDMFMRDRACAHLCGVPPGIQAMGVLFP